MSTLKLDIPVDVIQWTGCNITQVKEFIGYPVHSSGKRIGGKVVDRAMRVVTPNGIVYANEQDWIIKFPNGELLVLSNRVVDNYCHLIYTDM